MFNFILSLYTSKDLTDYYQGIGQMVRYGNYSLNEIENMIPYEFEIYTAILIQQLKKEKNKKNG